MRSSLLPGLLAAVPVAALAQMPQSGPAAATQPPASVATPASVPAVPPPAVQRGTTVPEQIVPGSGGPAGPANNPPFRGPPASGLPRGADTGQDGPVPPLSR